MEQYIVYLEILDTKRQKLLNQLKFLKKEGFYLAGGTALALQIKHRLSIDFDFYNQRGFDSNNLLEKLQNFIEQVTLIQASENTLLVKANGIEVSFFKYPYPLIKPSIVTENLNLASLEDIGAMKLIAIIQRGTYRDFVDLYFIIKKVGLAELLKLAERKYPPFNKYLALQSLTYFEDAEKEPKGTKGGLFKALKWSEIKNFITNQVREGLKSG